MICLLLNSLYLVERVRDHSLTSYYASKEVARAMKTLQTFLRHVRTWQIPQDTLRKRHDIPTRWRNDLCYCRWVRIVGIRYQNRSLLVLWFFFSTEDQSFAGPPILTFHRPCSEQLTHCATFTLNLSLGQWNERSSRKFLISITERSSSIKTDLWL